MWDELRQWVLDAIYVRNPMGLTVLYYLIAVATIGALAALTPLLRLSPTSRLGAYASRVTPSYPYVLLQVAVAAFVGVEILVEGWVTETLPYDLTPLVYQIEGHFVESIQSPLHSGPAGAFLDHAGPLVYMWGYYSLVYVPFLTFVFLGRLRGARTLALAQATVWAVGLPCYLFLPVNEVWITSGAPYNYGHVENLLTHASPGLQPSLIYDANINNNFPSIHVAVATAVPLACWAGGQRVWAWFLFPMAALVAASTMYLGIHWVLDVVAGAGLGWASVAFVSAWDRRAGRKAQREPPAQQNSASRSGE